MSSFDNNSETLEPLLNKTLSTFEETVDGVWYYIMNFRFQVIFSSGIFDFQKMQRQCFFLPSVRFEPMLLLLFHDLGYDFLIITIGNIIHGFVMNPSVKGDNILLYQPRSHISMFWFLISTYMTILLQRFIQISLQQDSSYVFIKIKPNNDIILYK